MGDWSCSPNGEKNDRVYLSINPTLGTTEPTWIANDATDANAELPSIVGAVQFMQKINTSANNPLTVTAKLKVSGLRVDTTWAEVGELDPSNGFVIDDQKEIKVYTSNNKIIVIGGSNKNIEVFDMLGKQIASLKNVDDRTEISANGKGVFVVRINDIKFKVAL